MNNEYHMNGFVYTIEINTNYNGTVFTGSAIIEHPCLSENSIYTQDNIVFYTEQDAIQFLNKEVDRVTKTPIFKHAKGKNIGETCDICNQVVGPNSIFII